MNKKYTRNIR